ncbi:hypothetical protein SAMN05216410_1493 [Sanguibacter gelidistatuariae]|uniref:Uncharacterized protein n=2 Tax=Sanguibacter gelidistatuariae TaxID=1814289 RepID=A0A1G6K3P8_9MICO|nr:hypothetical protein SAMN05216410_1493 [Sanguibacter gelidistatuariae]
MRGRLSDVTITSGHPVIAAVLYGFRRRISESEDQGFNLGADLGSGIRMTDLSVEAGTDLVLNARFG